MQFQIQRIFTYLHHMNKSLCYKYILKPKKKASILLLTKLHQSFSVKQLQNQNLSSQCNYTVHWIQYSQCTRTHTHPTLLLLIAGLASLP